MGTNYYLQENPCPGPCEHCRHSTEGGMHIGKSSGGWCFSLHAVPERGILSLDDWKPLIEKHPITNEYGESVDAGEMLDIIMARTGKPWSEHTWYGYHGEDDFHRSNHSERGPNGLLRHRIEQPSPQVDEVNHRTDFGNGCFAHGEGTWDMIIGYFS